FLEYTAPNWLISSIFLQVNLPVLVFIWQSLHNIDESCLPLSTRSGLLTTFKLKFSGVYFGVPLKYTNAATAPTNSAIIPMTISKYRSAFFMMQVLVKMKVSFFA